MVYDLKINGLRFLKEAQIKKAPDFSEALFCSLF